MTEEAAETRGKAFVCKVTELGRGRARIRAQGGWLLTVFAHLGLSCGVPVPGAKGTRFLPGPRCVTFLHPSRLSPAQGTGDFCAAPDAFILNITEGQLRTGNKLSGLCGQSHSGCSVQARGQPGCASTYPFQHGSHPSPPHPCTSGPAGPLGHF